VVCGTIPRGAFEQPFVALNQGRPAARRYYGGRPLRDGPDVPSNAFEFSTSYAW